MPCQTEASPHASGKERAVAEPAAHQSVDAPAKITDTVLRSGRRSNQRKHDCRKHGSEHSGRPLQF